MLGKLKGLFGSKDPGPAKSPAAGKTPPAAPAKPKPVRLKRVNINRRFTLISLTGQGSMSQVHKAVDNQNGRTVCLKVQNVAKHAAASARASTVDNRPPEGEIATRIVHPHVVRTFEYGLTSRGEHFMLMEFIDGVSLQFMREAHSNDLGQKLELLAQAAEGLAAVHAAGFIHHDIGPKNFLVNRDHHVKLIDFGLAIPNIPAFRRPGNRTGTLLYMAPELIRRETIDERIDIFSFGAMAFEFLTDRLPYDANDVNSMAALLQRINADPIDPAKANPRLPEPVCDLLRQLTARKRQDRWSKLSTLPDALREIPVPASQRRG
jgi:eukaryotic-like serine/threonine-protein kinase